MNYAQPKKNKPSPPPPPKPGPTFNLLVANMSFEAKSKDLQEFFIAEGANVVSAEVIFHDNPRRSSGYGFVAFKTRKEAEEALSTFSDKVNCRVLTWLEEEDKDRRCFIRSILRRHVIHRLRSVCHQV